MERNEVTTLSQLKTGDRFIKVGDKKKIVWEFTSVNSSDKILLAKKDQEKFPVMMKNETAVIFLRHNQN